MQFKKVTAGFLAAVLAVTSLSEAVFALPTVAENDKPTGTISEYHADVQSDEVKDTPDIEMDEGSLEQEAVYSPTVGESSAPTYEYIELEDGTVKLTECYGVTAVFEIPSTLGGKPVTVIGDYAFSWNENLTSITIPDSVTTIEEGAFYACINLTSITIPNSVTTIGNSAFVSCESLTSITIPDSVEYLEGSAFLDCSSLTSIDVGINNQNYSSKDGVLFNKDLTEVIAYPANKGEEYIIPDDVKVIGDHAFYDCTRLTSITIPDGVTSLEDAAFYGCENLEAINIPNSVTSLGAGVFSYCSSLTSLTIPDGVTRIGAEAFLVCYNLRSINIPKNVTIIEERVFCDCSGLTSISIPDSVTIISYLAFGNCSGLTSISIPDSVTIISDDAFYACLNLTSVTIPENVTTIGDHAFSACTSLASITVDKNNQYYSSSDGVIFNKSMTEVITCPEGKEGEYIIPDSVTSIGWCAFQYCSKLSSITLPDGLISIGDHAFYDCSNLNSITLPDGLISIAENAFYGTALLNNQPTAVKYVGKWAVDCDEDVTTAEIKSGTVAISDYAFDGCISLSSITIPDSVKSIGYNAFYDTALISEQSGTVKYADKWVVGCDTDAVTATIENGTVGIADNAFLLCESLTSITIPDSVTKSIGRYAFYSCSNLESIDLPDSVAGIGNNAFMYCSSLTSITIPRNAASIGKHAFEGCSNLTSINVDINNINFSSIDGVLLNKPVTEVITYPQGKRGDYDVPDGVTTIKNSAFEYCQYLSSITIPDSVTSIEDNAFFACWELEDVYYIGLKSQWDKIAIGTDNNKLLNATIHYGKHVSSDPIKENEISPTCGEEGSYEEVIICSDCGEEISRETVTVPATGEHIPGDTEIVDQAPAGHGIEGYVTEAVYCAVCGNEISRSTTIIPAVEHTPSAPVIKNKVDPTCGKEGHYEEVIYCTECREEISRETVTVPATGKHTYVDKVVAPTYTAQGYTEHTCSVCGDSYKDAYTAKKTVSNVSGLKIKGRAADALRLAWNKNTSADGYIIERKDGTKWTRVVKITKNSTTEYRIAKLKAGTSYNYRIRAYKMDGKTARYSGYTTISAKTKPSTVTGLKVKGRASDALRLSWTKNTSAAGYIIERKDGNKWVRVVKITKNTTTEYRIPKLKAGTAYTFRVKAYKMDGKTALYGATKTISVRTNPSAVSGLKLKASAKNAVRLAWTKNTGADGYIIEMKSGSKWVRVGKVTKNSTVEFRKGSLKSKTSYSFRIKAYKMDGKTALYGATKTITVKTK